MIAGVRARQEKVAFATCEDEGTVVSDVRPLIGKGLHSAFGMSSINQAKWMARSSETSEKQS